MYSAGFLLGFVFNAMACHCLLGQKHNVVAFPNRRHLRADGKNKLNLIGQQRLHGGGGAAHEYQLQRQPFALVESSFRGHHHRQYLYAR
ncbi:MAG TPA: hypothetical protein VGB27_16980 [Candidatus Binatia bacterium]